MSTAVDHSRPGACLVVERGDPYTRGGCFALDKSAVVLGRGTDQFSPDIAFDSLLISRRHCRLELLDGRWSISDLGSRHGTLLNGVPVRRLAPLPVNPGDKIGLAANVVLLRFMLVDEYEQTLDWNDTRPVNAAAPSAQSLPVVVDQAQNALRVDNKEISLSVKEWLLLDLLYEHRDELVPYAAICSAVWNERPRHDGVPDVGLDEVSILIYRLRRKLGPYGHLLKTRRGQGCILTLK